MNRRKVILKSIRGTNRSQYQLLDPNQPTINESNSTALAQQPSYKTLYDISQRQKRDKALRWRYSLICINSMIGIFLMIAGLQVAWDGGTLKAIQTNLAIRIANSVLTFIIVGQLLEYYRARLIVETKDWRSNKKYTFGKITPWMVLVNSGLAWEEILEICIVLLHPFPLFHTMHFWGDEKWGLLMFLRLYMLLHVVRDYSTIFRSRRKLELMYRYTPPKFGWFLSAKTYHYQNPIFSMTTLTLFVMLLFGYIIYIFEREHQDGVISFPVSLYLAFIAMVSGWPSDPFGDYNPVTIAGKACTIVSCFMGLLLLAALLELIMLRLAPTLHDRPAITWVAHYNMKKKQKVVAAQLIQLVYRRYKAEQKDANVSPYKFFRQYLHLTKQLKIMRREITLMIVQIEEIEAQAPQIFDRQHAQT